MRESGHGFPLASTAARLRILRGNVAALTCVRSGLPMTAARPQPTPRQTLLLVLRVAMEVGVVAGLAAWGISTGDGATAKILLGAGAPVVGFGIWGAVDFRQAGRAAEPLRLLQELVISGIAAVALAAAGAPAPGWALAALSVVYHALVYALGERLLDADHAAT